MTATPSPKTTSPWLPRVAVIESVTPETPGVQTYRLRLRQSRDAADHAFRPGQFNMLYLPGFGEAAISLSGPATPPAGESPTLTHTIREVGIVTHGLARLSPGGAVAVRGPYGKPWPLEECRGADVVLVAGGIGLAPLRSAIYELLAQRSDYGRLVLLCGARSPEHLLYAGEYAAWQDGGLEVQTTVDRAVPGWDGNVGVVPLLVDRLWPLDAERTVLMACGPEVMMRFVALAAVGRGLAPERIWLSLERHMQCAVGLCGHCQLGTALICRDGPVFSWNRVESLMRVHDL